MRTRLIRAIVAVLVVLAFTGTVARGQPLPDHIRVVKADALPAGDGRSWQAPYNDLQAALAEARGSGGAVYEIWIATGTYRPGPPKSDPYMTTFLVSGHIELYGGFAGNETSREQRDPAVNLSVLDADLFGDDPNNLSENVIRLVTLQDAAKLDGLSVINGFHYSLVASGETTVTDCRVIGSLSPSVSVAIRTSGNPTFINCFAQSRTGATMGPALNAHGGTFVGCKFVGYASASGPTCVYATAGVFTDCEFSGAGEGRGVQFKNVYAEGCTIDAISGIGGGASITNSTLRRCLIRGGGTGWGSYTQDPTLALFATDSVIEDCDIWANGISNYSSFNAARVTNSRLTNCTFTMSDQSAVLKCGTRAVYAYSRASVLEGCVLSNNRLGSIVTGTATLINCTIADNTLCSAAVGPGSTLDNCIVWGNTVDGEATQATQVAAGTPVSYSCIQGWTGSLGGTGNHGFDPLFEDSDGRLGPTSPCVDSARRSAVPPTLLLDHDGNPRIVDDPGMPNTGPGLPVDMGAFERQSPTCYANCDRGTTPPVLTVADFDCFITRFVAGEPYANCDGSTAPPRVNVADFACFLSQFAAACP